LVYNVNDMLFKMYYAPADFINVKIDSTQTIVYKNAGKPNQKSIYKNSSKNHENKFGG
jgi:hypothetical protein